MRRLIVFKNARRGLVAIYDALLFLMVVILISEGMFLYAATVSEGDVGFSDDHYQHQADTGRIMIEALSLKEIEALSFNESNPVPMIDWSNATANETQPLDSWVAKYEADTIQWLLDSYVVLTWRMGDGSVSWDGTYDTEPIMEAVNATFADNRLVGMDHAWLFLIEGEVELFGSNVVDSVEDLPVDRWVGSSDYTLVINEPDVNSYEAELRYFLWLQ